MAQRRRPVFSLGLGAILMITTSQAALAFTECGSQGGVITSLSTDLTNNAQEVKVVDGRFVCVEVTSGTDLFTSVADESIALTIFSSGGVEFVSEANSTITSEWTDGVLINNSDGLNSFNPGPQDWTFTDGPTIVQVDGTISGQNRGLISISSHSGEDRFTINGTVQGPSGLEVQHLSDEGTSTITIGADGRILSTDFFALTLIGPTIEESGPPPREGLQFTVVNNGIIEATGSNGLAFFAVDTSAGITNAGRITGGLSTQGGSTTFDNLEGATWDISDGGGVWDNTNPFSPSGDNGSDLFRNNGTFLSYGNSGFSGLDTFEMNGGVWRLDDGTAGNTFYALDTGFVANGGEIWMEVVLGGDDSVTDRLTFNTVGLGTAATGLRFTNLGGLGGETDQGILVVELVNGSDAGAFYLANEAPLEVGAFVYELTYNDQTPGFYLTTTGAVGPTATIYESAPALVFGAFGRMPTLAQRVGERQVGAGRDGFWLRGWGESGTATPDSSTAGAAWDFSGGGLQVGYDRTMQDTGAGRLVLGVTAQIGQASADVTNAAGAGTIEMDAAGLGLTATWYHDSGFYLDGQLSVNRVSADFATAAAGTLARGEEGTLTSFSLEAGRRFAVGANAALVPQAQLTFGRLNGADFTDASGNAVDLGSQSMTTARLGLAWEYRNPETPGTTVYIIGNLLRDLASETTVTVDGTTLTAKNDRTWAEIGLGGTFALNATTTAYAEGSYRTATDGGDNDAFALTAGFRKVW